jgi:excisionase family DNA binding protein
MSAEKRPSKPVLISTAEAAARLAMSQRYVARMVRSGRLRGYRLGEGKRPYYRVEEDSVEEYLELRRTGFIVPVDPRGD